MIPADAVEAAAKTLAESIGNAIGIWEMHSWATQDKYRKHARAALEAAAPHMQCGDGDREEVEERVKEIVQDVAMTVDYTERMYAAVQEIMNLTMPRATK